MPEIFTTGDGSHSLISDEFGVSYHSKHGAITETQTVFIDAGLLYRAEHLNEIAVLEIGFGTGLNALMTLAEAVKNNLKINYKTYEAYPVTAEQALTFNYSELIAPDLRAEFAEMHRCKWNEENQIHKNFSFRKLEEKFENINSEKEFDVIYFDAFAPNSQPELWEETLFQKMFDALKINGVLVTYSAKGSVRRAMQAVGFEIERLPGPPGKREMLRATKRI